MDWKLEDHTKGDRAGFLRILCDGQAAADVFPYGAGRDPQQMTTRAIYIVETLNAGNHANDLIARKGIKYVKKLGEVGTKGGGTDSHWRIYTPPDFRNVLISIAAGASMRLAA